MSEQEHRTTGPIRDSSIYVSWQTKKSLGYIPRAVDESIDGIAERWLSERLKQEYPNIVEHVEKQKQEDKDFRDSLKKVPFV